jgi:hypothetical protein
MVRIIVVAVFLLVITVPALAQEDFPRVEMSIGYGNLGYGFPGVTGPDGNGESGRRSGFVSTQGFNFTHWLGLENSLGYYGLGNNVSLFTNVFGAKLAARMGGVLTPFATAGIGGGSLIFEQAGAGYGGFNTKVGAGFDYGASDAMRLRIDVSRLGTKFAGISASGINVSVSVAFTLMN